MIKKICTGLLSVMMIAGGLMLTGCQSGDEPNGGSENKVENGPAQFEEPTEDAAFFKVSLTNDQKIIRDKNNEFAVELFKAISQNNKVVAPFSVFTTFAMLANGDDGEARDEILNHFNIQNGDLTTLNSYVKTMNEGFAKMYGKTRFCYANSIWTVTGGELFPEFESVMKDYYNGEFYIATADGEKNKEAINSWISEKTMGMLPNFLEGPITFNAALVNDLYFK